MEPLILSLSDVAARTPWTARELRRQLRTPDGQPATGYRGLRAVLHLPGGVTVPAHRSAAKAGWVVYTAQLTRAIDRLDQIPDPAGTRDSTEPQAAEVGASTWGSQKERTL